MKEQEPKYRADNFVCPHCDVSSQQRWFEAGVASGIINNIIHGLYLDYRSHVSEYSQEEIAKFLQHVQGDIRKNIYSYIPKRFSIASCTNCNDVTLWLDGKLVFPRKTSIPSPNEDMDEDIKALYSEAATIFNDSPKGATALLRLCLQKLLIQVGKLGKNINDDIKSLVADGLSPKIQQALDLLRVVGNNAVHPGHIDLDDNLEIGFKLFHILNFITNELITKPRELENLYDDFIPENTKSHIKKRDKVT